MCVPFMKTEFFEAAPTRCLMALCVKFGTFRPHTFPRCFPGLSSLLRRNMEGRFQIYTGNGKGKTTAALGLAVRAACSGLKVFIGQFMKGTDYSELCLPEKFPGTIAMEQFGTPRLICKGEMPQEADIKGAEHGMERLMEEMLSESWDLIIADELNVTVHMGLLPVSRAVELVQARPSRVELVATGRYAPAELMELADLITEMKEILHYYKTRGLQARRGIEY